MWPIEVVAVGAISALGRGQAAVSVGSLGSSPRCVARLDAELAAAGLKKPFAARAELPGPPGLRAETILAAAWSDLRQDLDARLPSWDSLKIGLALGTSAGGMPSLTEVFERRDRGEPIAAELARGAPYFGPLRALAGLRPKLCTQVLAACASSSVALGIACRWLEAGHVELVIAGGYDTVSVFVAAGFESLGATSAGLPQPFRAERDGMVLGEGAALLALARQGPAEGRRSYGFLHGFAASSDAVHVTAPDRTGRGLLDAAQAALADAGVSPEAVELVSAHATATPYNDAAEARVLDQLFEADAARVVVHPFKAVIGHTLGAAGALELLAALSAMRAGLLPAAVGSGPVDPAFRARLLAANAAGSARCCLKLSAAFGGSNAALVGSTEPPRVELRPPYPVSLLAAGEVCGELDVELAAACTLLEQERLARLDAMSALVLAAALGVQRRYGKPLPEHTGLVLGTGAATLEINEQYDRRRRTRGARFVEPRRFPATSPNLACGQASIALGLRGPCFAVGASRNPAREALLVAHDLLAAGDAPAVLVVAAEDVGPTVESIWHAAGWPVPGSGAAAVLLGRSQELPRLSRTRLLEWEPQPDAEPGGAAALLAAALATSSATSS